MNQRLLELLDKKLLREELHRRGLKFNPNHLPAGTPEGGEFTTAEGSGDIGGEADTSTISGGRQLTGPELYAISDYKNTGYYDINDKLRHGRENNLSQNQKNIVAVLDKVISENTVHQETTVYRIIDGKRAGDKYMNDGAEITDKAFMSTATREAAARRAVIDTGGGRLALTVVEIRLPRGTHAFDVQSHITRNPIGALSQGDEAELLLGRNTTLKILSVDKDARRVIATISHNRKAIASSITKAVITQEATPALVRLAERLEPALLLRNELNRRSLPIVKAVSEVDRAILARFIEKLDPVMRKRFLQIIARLESAIDLHELTLAIQSGNIARAETLLHMDQWPEQFGDLAIDLRISFLGGVKLGAATATQFGLAMSFNLIDPFAVAYARNRVPQLAEIVQTGARELVRDIITQALQGELTAVQAAKQIKLHIGLLSIQEQRVRGFEKDLYARAEAMRQALMQEGKLSQERIDAKVMAFTDKIPGRVDLFRKGQLDQRALTIARTEISLAANAGQLQWWQEAVRQGLLPKEVRKKWLVYENPPWPCPNCESIGDADSVPLNEPFRYMDGTVATNVFGEVIDAPPQHPNCFCTMVLDLEPSKDQETQQPNEAVILPE